MNTGKSGDEALKNIKRAYELRGRVSDAENYSISFVYYRDAIGDLEKALEIEQRCKQAYPNKALTFFEIGYLQSMLGRHEEALASTLESIRLEPTVISYLRAMSNYLALNRLDEARAMIQEARARKMDQPAYYPYILYLIAFNQKNKAEMAANETAALRYVKPEVLEINHDVYRGRLSSLRHSLPRNTMSLSNMTWGARTLALVGYAAEAKAAAINISKMSKDRDHWGNAAITLGLARDKEGAQNLAADLSKRFPESTYVRFCFVPSVRALLALEEGKPHEAIDILAETVPYEMMQNMITVYLRGKAYLAAQQGVKAAAEFQKMLEHHTIQFWDILRNILPHLGLARAYALQGDTAKARKSYQDFLTLWKDADPDIPILKQAKAEYAKLQEGNLP